jgi:beta-aspartyl-peptidase (threonine type)
VCSSDLTLEIGALCVARHVKNPIRLARERLRGREILLAGVRGATEAPTAPAAAQALGCDTVGAVVRDAAGRMAAAVSTGGLTGAPPGRVGDSPLPGCGFYVNSRIGGVVATGVGESIARTLLSGRAVWEMERGATPEAALSAALSRLAQVGGEAGLIAVSSRGEIAFAHRGDQLAVGWAEGPQGRIEIRITKEVSNG